MVNLPVGNIQKAVINILSTNNAPAVNQSYTLYGSLQDGGSGAPLAGQPVTVTILSSSGGLVSIDTTTNANGAYAITRSESAPDTYWDTVYFQGNSGYFATNAMVFLPVGNLIPTTLSLNITDNNPDVNQPFTI